MLSSPKISRFSTPPDFAVVLSGSGFASGERPAARSTESTFGAGLAGSAPVEDVCGRTAVGSAAGAVVANVGASRSICAGFGRLLDAAGFFRFFFLLLASIDGAKDRLFCNGMGRATARICSDAHSTAPLMTSIATRRTIRPGARSRGNFPSAAISARKWPNEDLPNWEDSAERRRPGRARATRGEQTTAMTVWQSDFEKDLAELGSAAASGLTAGLPSNLPAKMLVRYVALFMLAVSTSSEMRHWYTSMLWNASAKLGQGYSENCRTRPFCAPPFDPLGLTRGSLATGALILLVLCIWLTADGSVSTTATRALMGLAARLSAFTGAVETELLGRAPAPPR